MENSKIKRVMLNDHYLFVQSEAETSATIKYEYTWVFTKGSRTYLNAYHVIDHSSSNVDIFLDRDNSHLYIGDTNGLTLYEIGEPRIMLHYLNK